ncbi:hypothetical protein KFZ76_00620 [Methylovulum psychrotolerans]|uniref:PepSY domain-containing protein n=1 Tax=Methylovulum psychrotolerans TaxID=1704499 RepID=UPI001BFF9734|nr:PepSY domain-containing protein [Methylovulum psychrotolerans]MBT9096211.1 hypothetical protein [Methylovulum psychrotolerans]
MKTLNALIASVLMFVSLQASAAVINKTQAETIAETAIQGGTVLQAHFDRRDHGIPAHWDIDIANPGANPTMEAAVWVDASTGTVIKIIYQKL